MIKKQNIYYIYGPKRDAKKIPLGLKEHNKLNKLNKHHIYY